MRDAILPPGMAGELARAFHRLCGEAPPVGPKRPANRRWTLFDAGHYPALAEAYAAGQAGAALRWPPDTLCAVAWLAGQDRAA